MSFHCDRFLRSFSIVIGVTVLAASVSCRSAAAQSLAGADSAEYDVVIYGGTSAAVSAAVQVARSGKSVIIVSPDKHLGGLTAGGLGWTDSGNKDAIGGISREFYHRVWKHYQQADVWKWQPQSEFGNRNQGGPGRNGDGRTMWVFEPHVAEQIFEDLVREEGIPVVREELLDRTPAAAAQPAGRVAGVTLDGRRITAITMQSGRTYKGRVFIDATYEGDLMAGAGVSYHVGREANSVYDEQWNGIQVGVLHHGHWFAAPISAYVVPGDPNSGLLPEVSSEPPGIRGEGDHRVQAYCFRMCLTNHEENRIPFPRPPGYDRKRYELLTRVLATGWREAFRKFDMMPNYKTDTNNHGPFSTDFIGRNYEYPEASYEQRAEIIREHELYQKGLMYFLANDPDVPDDVRDRMSEWGLAADEFRETGGWPHQIYVREARRMIGEYVMTEHDCFDAVETPMSVGMGSYTLDSHNVQRYVTPEGNVQNEGDIGVRVPEPYEISYGSIVPKQEECTNLLVPVCVSSSHIAFGSIRMEPVFMILGQSAATAAAMAIDSDLPVQQVKYAELEAQLEKDGQVLHLEFVPAINGMKLDGIVVDDSDAERFGGWQMSNANQPFVGGGYRHNSNLPSEQTYAVFRTELKSGQYEVRLYWPVNSNRASDVPVTVTHADGETSVTVNQRTRPENPAGPFISLGTYRFTDSGAVTIRTAGTDGHVILDAVQWVAE